MSRCQGGDLFPQGGALLGGCRQLLPARQGTNVGELGEVGRQNVEVGALHQRLRCAGSRIGHGGRDFPPLRRRLEAGRHKIPQRLHFSLVVAVGAVDGLLQCIQPFT